MMMVPASEYTFQYSVGWVDVTNTHPEVVKIEAMIFCIILLILFGGQLVISSTCAVDGYILHGGVWPWASQKSQNQTLLNQFACVRWAGTPCVMKGWDVLMCGQ